ncbi:hypothetical protein V1227_24915 [Lentzea sp. DG1S-22]|uniref:hypothetical protein n=1 Tax=Lentzea sp. DG1S-22 TaxID=3108822 RepID=UPI002E75C662|nr:hypothetical protein [Lentzea sp. DG1S-22]WVH78312.1 hypothetical protein V1227_24915 [Lentzea sp. DG1S-22]
MLFVVWLVLPPAYVVLLGRRYVREARAAAEEAANAAQEAAWASADVQDALDDLESGHGPQQSAPVSLPTARSESTQELPAIEFPTSMGKHRLDEAQLARRVAS